MPLFWCWIASRNTPFPADGSTTGYSVTDRPTGSGAVGHFGLGEVLVQCFTIRCPSNSFQLVHDVTNSLYRQPLRLVRARSVPCACDPVDYEEAPFC